MGEVDDLGYGYVSVKGKGSNECILSSSNMHFTANKGNITRPSSYQSCSPGAKRTQPMRLPTPAHSRCTYPRCTAKAAQLGERAQHSTVLDDRPLFTKARKLQVAACSLRRCDMQAMSAFPLSLLISALSSLDILVGRAPVSLALHRAE